METTTHPPVENSEEEVKILRNLRDKLIQLLKVFDLIIVSDFKISSSGSKTTDKMLQIVFTQNQHKFIEIVNKIKEDFIKCEIHTSGKGTITVDFKAHIAETLKKGKVIVVEENTSQKKAGYQTLLGEIRESLSSIIPLDELNKQYVLKKYDGRNDAAEVIVSDSYTRNKALGLLESKGYKVLVLKNNTVICTTAESKLLETLGSSELNHQLGICKSWFSQIEHWLGENQIPAELITHPLTIVQSNYEEKLVIICDSPGVAVAVQNGFLLNGIVIEKTGKTIYIQLSKIIVAKPFLQSKIELNGLANTLENGGIQYVYSSYDYDSFHLLPFNRDIDEEHAEGIGQSIDEFGVIDFIKVIETDCIDGELKKWIADGQHTFTTEKKRKLPILYVIIRISTLEEVVRLTAVLNNRRKAWKNGDYLRAWVSLKAPIYLTIQKWILRKKMQFSLILESLSGRDNKAAIKLFKDGKFVGTDTERGEVILQYLEELKPLMGRSMKIHLGFLRAIKKIADYDNKKMIACLQSRKDEIIFTPDDSMDLTILKIINIYKTGIKA